MNSTGFNGHTTGAEVAERFASLIAGKTVLITGVNIEGLGGSAAQAIATAKPALILLSARSIARAQPVADSITTCPTQIVEMDLGSLASVRKAAASIDKPIDILINNAAVMAAGYSTTEDGFETQFGVGHLGHFLFTNLLLKEGKINSGGRIINISSTGHKAGGVRFDDPGFSGGEKYEKWAAYGQAKTANMLFSVALAERLKSKNIKSYSLHPGGIMTPLQRHIQGEMEAMLEAHMKANPDAYIKTLQEGCSTHLVAAFDPSIADSNGRYLEDCQISNDTKDYAQDPENAKKLWTLSEELVGQRFDI